MSRVGPLQPDLFAPPPEPAPEPPSPERPLEELAAMLARLRGAERMPWPTVGAVMEQEYRVMHWARLAGAEGKALQDAIFDEIERIFAAEERAALA